MSQLHSLTPKNSTSDYKKIIIHGVTETGEKFRPTDWADRMCGSLATIHNHRIRYSPMLHPIYDSGRKCVILDPTLKENNEALFDSIIQFAKLNKLVMVNFVENTDKVKDNV